MLMDMRHQNLLSKYIGYRKMVEKKAVPNPKRIIFYRDGVSEGQFKTVLETEVPRIKCTEFSRILTFTVS